MTPSHLCGYRKGFACLTVIVITCLLLRLPIPSDASMIGRGRYSRTGVIFSRGCSVQTVSLTANSVNDIYTRLLYPNTTSVLITVASNITVNSSDGLFLNQSFSCTRFLAANLHVSTTWINSTRNDMPALRVWRAVNVDFIGISFSFPVDYTNMPACSWRKMPEWANGLICPAVHIYWSYNVRMSFGWVIGRTDIYRSGIVRISYMKLYFNFKEKPFTATNYATLRIGLCGDNKGLVRSQIIISNNEIYGSWNNILVYYYAVGVVISNNNLMGAQFAGIQCSVGVNNVADCMLSSFVNNLITPASNPNGDGAGIYFDTHWYSPGNLASCNYITGNAHCYYIDYASSHVLIDGGVCYKNGNGVKMNAGAFNLVKSLLVIQNKQYAASLSCQNYCENNCLSKPGSSWFKTFNSTYEDLDDWQRTFPNLLDWCDRTEIDGVSCNPNITLSGNITNDGCQTPDSDILSIDPSTGNMIAAPSDVTGGCSGIPHMNSLDLIVVQGPKLNWAPLYFSCGALPSVRKLNNITSSSTFNYPQNFFGFNDVSQQDFGVDNLGDRIYQLYPSFKSCPKKNVGIQPVANSGIKLETLYRFAGQKKPAEWYLNSFVNYPVGGGTWNDRAILSKMNDRILESHRKNG